MITIKAVNKFYNKRKSNALHVLKDVSLELPDTGIVAIFGRSGCGKTTLLNLIGGLDKFDDGQILIDNQSIRTNTDTLRNREIGYIFQNYNLNNKENCYENVASALKLCGMEDNKEIDERVTAALENVGMDKYRLRYPNTLSGGQMQRIAIARAIVKNPKIILADEPTGNLDEHNTIMIMDLLREISKTHLVILVTHEANLVNLYCDKVIALSDGKVISERDNEILSSYVARDKNKIYLGELEKKEENSNFVNVEYYGKDPNQPLDIQVINYNGKMYLKLKSPNIQILDENSEVKLEEGAFHTEGVKKQKEMNMKAIPSFTGTKYGRLFNLKDSIKSGFRDNFLEKKIGNKILKIVLGLLSFILVMLVARFGVSIRTIFENESKVDKQVFYVYTPTKEYSKMLENAKGDSETGIVATRLLKYSNIGANQVSFDIGKFESYTSSNQLGAEVYKLPLSVIDDKKVLAGTINDLVSGEVVISSMVADKLIKESSVGYVSKYRDIIGFVVKNGSNFSLFDYDIGVLSRNTSYRIVGIVESEACEIYYTDFDLSSELVFNNYGINVAPASLYGYNIASNETIYVSSYGENATVGSTVTINDKNYTVVQVTNGYDEMFDYTLMDKYVINDADFCNIYKYFGNYSEEVMNKSDYYYDQYYTLIYSNNVDKTEMFLNENFKNVKIEDVLLYGDDYKVIYTPNAMRERVYDDTKGSIRTNLITLLIFVILLSVCMYFIMHSMMISRIKEIGIYRAIGVNKKNLVFKFWIETIVLTTLTVIIGYLIASGLLFSWTLKAGVIKEILYYPGWIALIVLVFLYLISSICGILPIIMLLRKTPSGILSKYDI